MRQLVAIRNEHDAKSKKIEPTKKATESTALTTSSESAYTSFQFSPEVTMNVVTKDVEK